MMERQMLTKVSGLSLHFILEIQCHVVVFIAWRADDSSPSLSLSKWCSHLFSPFRYSLFL